MIVPALPPALAPWAPWLRMFPADLALSLGPLIQRLAAALGPFVTPAGSGDGEPDGFSGLTRRGNYERLLVSEWLLAELVPDEFLRRAATSEHAFLKLERREPALVRTSVALFDAGPTQLGGPRIAHLAALIALAHRAETSHASLAWGILQQPDAPLVTATTPTTIRALLRGRTAHPVGADHWNAWRARGEAEQWQDLWLIGGPVAPALRWSRSTHSIEIREPITEGPSTLDVVVRTASGRTTPVQLPLPDGPSCIRLMRDPFPHEDGAEAVDGARSSPYIPDSDLIISAHGDRVFARARGGGVIIYPVPHSARGGVGRPKRRFTEVKSPAAYVAWHNRGLAAVFVARPGPVVLYHRPITHATGDQRREYPHDPVPIVATRQLRALNFRSGRALILDGADKLLGLVTNADPSLRVHIVDEEVAAVAMAPRWVARVAGAFRGPEELMAWDLIIEEDASPARHIDLGVGLPLGAYFAHHDKFGCLAAINFDVGHWRLHGMGDHKPEYRTTDRVIGLLAAQPGFPNLGPALITLGDDQRSFFARHETHTRLLTVATNPVVHAVLSTVTGHLAYVTAHHTVVVLRPPYDAPLARFIVKHP